MIGGSRKAVAARGGILDTAHRADIECESLSSGLEVSRDPVTWCDLLSRHNTVSGADRCVAASPRPDRLTGALAPEFRIGLAMSTTPVYGPRSDVSLENCAVQLTLAESHAGSGRNPYFFSLRARRHALCPASSLSSVPLGVAVWLALAQHGLDHAQ